MMRIVSKKRNHFSDQITRSEYLTSNEVCLLMLRGFALLREIFSLPAASKTLFREVPSLCFYLCDGIFGVAYLATVPHSSGNPELRKDVGLEEHPSRND